MSNQRHSSAIRPVANHHDYSHGEVVMPQLTHRQYDRGLSAPAAVVSASPDVDPKLKLRVNQNSIQPDSAYTATRLSDGSIKISINQNRENSVALGYVRKNGAYSTASSATIINDGRGSLLMRIYQRGTYDLKVEHNDQNTTDIVVKADQSLRAIKIMLGGKEYYLELDKIKNTNNSDSHTQKTVSSTAESPDVQRLASTQATTSANENHTQPFKVIPEQEAKEGTRRISSSESLSDHKQLANVRTLSEIPRVVAAVNQGKKVETSSGESKTNSPEKPIYSSLPEAQKAALKILQENNQRTKTILKEFNSYDSSEKISKVISELDSANEAFQQSVKTRRDYLISERVKHTPGTSEYSKYSTFLEHLDTQEDKQILLKKQLLEKQVGFSTGKEAVKINEQLFKMKDAVGRAYEREFSSSSLSDVEKASMEAERTAFKESMDAHAANRSSFRKSYDWFKSITTKNIERPSWAKAGTYVTKWSEYALQKNMKTFLENVQKTNVGDISLREAKTQIGVIEKQVKHFADQIKQYDVKLSSGDLSAKPTLDTLKEVHARATIRAGELLEKLVAETSESSTLSKYKKQLASYVEGVGRAYEKINQGSLGENFRARNEAIVDEIKREGKIAEFSGDKKLNKEAKNQQTLDKQLTKEQEGTPKQRELKAAKEVSQAAENIRLAELELDKLENSVDPRTKNDILDKQINEVHKKLTDLREAHLEKDKILVERKVETVQERIKVIDVEVEGKTDQVDKSKLLDEKRVLESKKAELDLERLKMEAEGPSFKVKEEIRAIREKVKSLEEQLTKEPDATHKSSIQEQISKENRSLLRKEMQHMTTEELGLQKQLDYLSDLKKDVLTKIESKTQLGELSEVEKLKSDLTKIEKSEGLLQKSKEYFVDQKKIIRLESDINRAKSMREVTQKELQAFKKTDITPVEQPRIDELKKRVTILDEYIKNSSSDLKVTKRAVHGRWSAEINRAKSILNVEMPSKISEWSGKNPGKAITLFGGLAEGIRHMSEASYEDDRRHTYIPSLLLMLDSDLEDGFLGLPFTKDATTGEVGVTGAALMEFSSGAGNVPLVLGGLKGVEKTARTSVYLANYAVRFNHQASLKATTALSEKTGALLGSKLVGRTLGGAGAALDGFMTFQNIHSWQDDNDRQLATKVSSPIVIGAGFGAFFGPPGAAVGALGGAIGEGLGVTYALYKLEWEIEKDWRKRGVRDSISNGEEGYLLAHDHPIVQNRSSELKDWEKETIHDLTIKRLLGQIFSNQESGQSALFTNSELKVMGFKLEGADAGMHNYNLLNELVESPRYRYIGNETIGLSTRVWESKSRKLFDSNRPLWDQIQAEKRKCENHYIDMYRRAPRLQYEPNTGGQAPTVTREMPQFFSELGNHYLQKMKELDREIAEKNLNKNEIQDKVADLQWQVLIEKVPHLPYVLRDSARREAFFSQFNAATSIDLRNESFWKYRTLSPVGQEYCRVFMPESFNEIPSITVSNALDNAVARYNEDLEEE